MKTTVSALIAIMLAVIAVGAAPPASAHAVRLATDPAIDATLTTSPPKVSATFNERLQESFAAMTVVGPDGNLWSTDKPSVHGAVIDTAVLPLGPAGVYTVNYRVTSADGHVVSGSWPFHLTVAGTGNPHRLTSKPSAPAGTIPWLPFVIPATVLVVGGMWWALRRRGTVAPPDDS